MTRSEIWIAPHLRVLVADADPLFRASLKGELARIGFEEVDEADDAALSFDRLQSFQHDIVMLEIAPGAQPVWDYFGAAGPGERLIVGMSLDRSGRDWIPAIHKGADAILMKAYHGQLLQPVLAHLLASRAAHRARLVQFPVNERREQDFDDYDDCRFEEADG